MKKLILLPVALGLLSLVPACSSSDTNRKVDEKLNAEPQPTSNSALRSEAQEMIQNSTQLTQDQKTKLLSLGESLKKELDGLNNESLKLRALLVKEVISDKYNSKEVDAIKKRIKAIYDQRTKSLFGAVDKVNDILGRNIEKEKVMTEFVGRRGDFDRP